MVTPILDTFSAKLNAENVRCVNSVMLGNRKLKNAVIVSRNRTKNLARLKFEPSEAFRERLRIRHRIEEKNGGFFSALIKQQFT